jgi:hypothetical protein
MWPFCQVFGCPFRKENEIKADKLKAERDKELEWQRQAMIEHGINYGGMIYVEGQQND